MVKTSESFRGRSRAQGTCALFRWTNPRRSRRVTGTSSLMGLYGGSMCSMQSVDGREMRC